MAGKEPVSKNLSASNIRYLLTLRELEAKAISKRELSRRENSRREGSRRENATGIISDKNAGVRYIEISNALGISRASAYNMIDTFINAGLVGKNTHGTLFLTVEGNDVASRYGRYYTAVSEMLEPHFPGLGSMENAVCSLLAEIPESCLERLCAKRAEYN